MSVRKPRQCMTTKGAPGGGDRGHHARVGEAAADVVDEDGARRERPLGDGGAHRVHGDRDALRGQAPHHGDDPPSSSSSSTRVAPGRVDSPPTSTRSAPCATRSMPCLTAAVVSNQRPPSEKESGVTFTTPMTAQRSHSGSPWTDPRPRNVLIPPA